MEPVFIEPPAAPQPGPDVRLYYSPQLLETLVEHGPWTVITVRLDGRARVVECDACGIRVTRIGTSPVVSQPACRIAPAGADRSSTS